MQRRQLLLTPLYSLIGLAMLALVSACYAGSISQDVASAIVYDATINTRRIAAYRAVIYDINDSVTIKKTFVVRNKSGGTPASKIIIESAFPDGKKNVEIYIIKSTGAWLVKSNQEIERLKGIPPVANAIPIRLPTADLLALKGKLQCEISEIDYFGAPSLEISTSLAESDIALCSSPGFLMGKLTDAQLYAFRDAPKDTKIEIIKDFAERQFAARYVYVVNKLVPFVLSWKSYSCSGRLIAEVKFQEFEVLKNLPDSEFFIPDGAVESEG